MKYITPSIEVVSFNSSDAPRIGMQWWAEIEGWVDYAPLGQNWTFSGTYNAKCGEVEGRGFFDGYGPVAQYRCFDETYPGAWAGVDGQGRNYIIVVDDHRSC